MSSNTRLRKQSDTDSTAVIARWMRRCGLPLAILAWSAVALLVLWLAGHVTQALFLLTIGALFAYALAPAVKVLQRVMPRFLAILVVYLLVLSALIALLSLIVSTAISQFVALSAYVRFLLTPGKGAQVSQLDLTLRSFGLSPSQITSARDQVEISVEGFAGSVVPGYIVAQLRGSSLACPLLWALFSKVGMLGATEPGPGIGDWQAAHTP